jgi:uncharacterized protein
MDKVTVIANAEVFAIEKMKGYDGGHDWLHIERVRNLSARINSYEKIADPFILELAALLHDVNDSKFRKDQQGDGFGDLREFLDKCGLDDVREHIIAIIKGVSFSSRDKTGSITDPALMVLQDADRLDAIGAIGIARAFNYGGFRNNPIFIPAEKMGELPDSTIKHFYDKLLKIKSLMNTETGKRIALDRHQMLENFLQHFYMEWDEDMKPVE